MVLLESPEVSRLLQLAGGAVLVAATVGAAVPAEVSRRLASELDERGWDGDGELAALLRAEPLGPAPGQRTVSVGLEEVADLLQGDTELSYGSYGKLPFSSVQSRATALRDERVAR